MDGTSLTVCDVGDDWFNFMLVQYTQSKIVVPRKKVGDRVNLEVCIAACLYPSLVCCVVQVDVLGKYVVAIMDKINKANSKSAAPAADKPRSKL